MAIFAAGHVLTAADFDTLFPTGIGAWTAYIPTLTQSSAVAATVLQASYFKVGRSVTATGFLQATAAGSAGSAVTISLPFAEAATLQIGAAYVYDASTSTRYVCAARTIGSSTIAFYADGAFGTSSWGVAPNLALASGDQVGFTITYQSTT